MTKSLSLCLCVSLSVSLSQYTHYKSLFMSLMTIEFLGYTFTKYFRNMTIWKPHQKTQLIAKKDTSKLFQRPYLSYTWSTISHKFIQCTIHHHIYILLKLDPSVLQLFFGRAPWNWNCTVTSFLKKYRDHHLQSNSSFT